MAKDLYDNFQSVRNLYEKAHAILGFDLAQISFNGPEEELKQTRVTQPAIFVHSIAVLEVLSEYKKEMKPDMVAGHSLGEYSALLTAGAFTFDQGLMLVKVRAELMQKAGEINPGTMAAVIGLEAKTLQQICQEVTQGVVQVANINSPGQLVISGEIQAVNQAMELAKNRGARRVIPLPVSGAFHSPLMAFAYDGFKNALDETSINDATLPVYSNVTAQPVTKAGEIKDLLSRQLTHPVRWVEIIENMIRDGANEFYEIGPGNVLSGLIKRINRQVNIKSIGTLKDIEEV